MYLDPGDLRRDREIEKSATSNLACVVPSAALAEQWQLNGLAAALGSYTTDHGRLQASCTNSGRLPPSERSNDRSPTNGGLRVRRAGHHHARALPWTAWQCSPGAYRCHFYCSRCLSALSLLSAPVLPSGVSSLHTPPGLCRAFAPRLYLHPHAF